MNVFIFGNNWVCGEIISFLNSKEGVCIRGICLNQRPRQKHREKILALLADDVLVLEADEFGSPATVSAIQSLECEIAFSCYFGHMIPCEILNLFEKGVVNIHPSFLPFNKGSAPNVFCLLDDTPAGVTVHYLDEGLDTGAIVQQVVIDKEPVDTGQSLYRKLEVASVQLFKEVFPTIFSGDLSWVRPQSSVGTCYKHSDLKKIDEIDLNKKYLAKDLINILRARTFPPYDAAYFVDENGRKVFIRVDLSYAK